MVIVYNTVSVPGVIAVSKPVPDIVALPLITLHTPPVTVSINIVYVPAQIVESPIMVPVLAGVFTVTGIVAEFVPQLLVSVYDIFASPPVIPVTSPVLLPTVAMLGLSLVHVPPEGEELKVIVDPAHTEAGPETGSGNTSTVTVCVAKQPPAPVYVISAVPIAMPVMSPVTGSAVAIPVDPEAHVPPEGELLNVVTAPAQTVAMPVIADGVVLTVTSRVTKQPPGSV